MDKILFVDDDLNLLSGLKRGLRPLRKEWNMHFVSSAQEALAWLDNNAVDIVVSDYRMPEMTGFELLDRIQRDHPHIVRIILTGQPDQDTYTESINICHYFLWKPLDIEEFKPLLQRLKELSSILTDPKLTAMLHGLTSLPTLPAIYTRLVAFLDNPEGDINELTKIVNEDVALTMQILKMVNSAFIGLMRQIDSLEEALQYLGLNTLRSLVLAQHIYCLSVPQKDNRLQVQELWEHSLNCSRLAEGLVRNSKDNHMMAYASFGGLLHDVGKLVLMHSLPEEHLAVRQKMKNQQMGRIEAEQSVLGTNHAAIGAYLALLWGLPHSVVEAIYLHHKTDLTDFYGLSGITTAVWHANRISRGDLSKSKEQWQTLKQIPELAGLLRNLPEEKP